MTEPAPSPRARLHLVVGLALAAWGTGLGPWAVAQETMEAREQARLCERLDEEPAIEACRAALALGLRPVRRRAVREVLANHLIDLERWAELAEHYREDVRLAPEDALTWFRLGSTLLFALDERAEALAALEESARLDPADASIRSVTAIALHALERYQEAAAAFDEAERLDSEVLEGRPAAQAVREAARNGEPWP